jgi:hypothetical protein
VWGRFAGRSLPAPRASEGRAVVPRSGYIIPKGDLTIESGLPGLAS